MSNKCLKCKVRGDCCYVNIEIEGYNIILDNVHCPYLNIDTGLCTVYEERHQYPWCLDDGEMFEKGCLPSECEYLKDKHTEMKPKIRLGVILNDISIPTELKRKIILQHKFYDRFPFERFIDILYKKEEVKMI